MSDDNHKTPQENIAEACRSLADADAMLEAHKQKMARQIRAGILLSPKEADQVALESTKKEIEAGDAMTRADPDLQAQKRAVLEELGAAREKKGSPLVGDEIANLPSFGPYMKSIDEALDRNCGGKKTPKSETPTADDAAKISQSATTRTASNQHLTDSARRLHPRPPSA